MPPSQGRPLVALLCAALLAATTGCSGARAVNTPLEQYRPGYGYQPTDASQFRPTGDTFIVLAFSGGGTRAAAFAYGVMQELYVTRVVVDGQETSLLDQVDAISGVSGGSFPAAYYGVHGNQIFEEFEARFVRKNVQGALFWRALIPWNLVALLTPWLSRSDLASRYYDEHVFDRATFADITKTPGPRIHINATDLSSGERFTFNQATFDVMCSDLQVLPIATACAASSAVPMLLSPIAMKNHAGTCGYTPPGWVQAVLDDPDASPRQQRSIRNFELVLDVERKPYIHLIDGGISDNLGLRPVIDFVNSAGGARQALAVHDVPAPRRMVVVVVNAETDPNPKIDLSLAAPGFAQLMNSVSGGQIRRYNFETLMLVRDSLELWGRDLSTSGHTVETYFIDVSFDGFSDPEKVRYFKRMPTSFALSDERVDDLIEAGRELLRSSPDFERLLSDME